MQFKAEMLRTDIENLIGENQVEQCIARLLDVVRPGAKRNEVLQIKARFREAEKEKNLSLIEGKDFEMRRNNVVNAILSMDFSDNELISEPGSVTNKFEVWIYCFDLDLSKTHWEEKFEKIGVKNNIHFKNLDDSMPSSDNSFIFLFDLTGIIDHKHTRDFSKLTEPMQDFLWFMLEMEAGPKKYEKLLFDPPQSFICQKLCPSIKLINIRHLGDEIKNCLTRIAEGQEKQSENEIG